MTFRNLTTRAKVQLGAILAGALSMQVDAVKNVVTPLLANHPKLVSLAGAGFTIVTLLQNPAIQHILGIEDHEEKKVESPDGTVETTSKTTSTTVAEN